MDLEKRMAEYRAFLARVEEMKAAYEQSRDLDVLVRGIRSLAADRTCHPYGDHLILLGDSYMENGDSAAGAACLTAVEAHFPSFNNETVFRLRMAQHHMESGDPEAARESLLALCRSIDNYEECIEWNGLTAVWEKYRHLVEGLVKPSVSVMTSRIKTPAECAMSIGEILALPDEDLLNALSVHLQELSADGDSIQSLNKWERAAYYVDELCMEVNSGGFDSYLYYHGTHFEKAYKALEQMGAGEMTALLDRIREKFPRKRIPKSAEAIQNTMERMEEKGVDFEAEDDRYYACAEKELLERLTAFVRENSKRFR